MSNYQPVTGNFDANGNLLQLWGPNGKVAFDPDNVSLTGGVIGEVPIDSRVVVTLPTGTASLAAAIPNTFERLKRARAERPFVVMFDSDSTSVGVSSASNPQYLAGRLLGAPQIFGQSLRGAGVKVNNTVWFAVSSLQSIGGSNAKPDPRVTVGAGWTENNSFWSNTTTANKLSFKCDEPVDTCQLIYLTNGGTGSITLDIGGSALFTASVAVASSTVATAPIALGVPDLYTINIGKALAADTGVLPVGIIAWNSMNPGVVVVNIGASGKPVSSAAGHSSGANGNSSSYMWAALQPDLAMLSFILNDFATPVATYSSDLSAVIGFASRSGAADVILYDGPNSSPARANYANQASIVAAAKAVAAAKGIPYLSCSAYLGANPGGASTNFVDDVGHCTPTAYAKLYSALAAPIAQIAGSN